MRVVLGNCKMSRSVHSPATFLKVYIEPLPGFNHVCSPGDLSTTLLS